MRSCLNACVPLRHKTTAETLESVLAQILERLVTRIPEGIFLQLSYMLNTQGNVASN